MALFDASSSSGGSINSARSSGFSNSWSNTNGSAATASSNAQAALANNTALAASREAQNYNAEQAQIQREWQERMANTVYQRSVKDMKAAGINPILAANMGLGTASVGSGASASISNPSTFMGNSFADQNSASHSENQSESSGKSWQNSESGLATFLTSMQTWVEGMIGALNSSKTIEVAVHGLENFGQNMDNKGLSALNPFAHHTKDGEYKPGSAQGILFQEIGKSISKLIGKK